MANRRFILVLAIIVVALQLTTLYKSYRNSHPVIPEPVVDLPPGSSFDAAGFPAEGPTNIKVVLAEFSDFECPFCQKYSAAVGKQVQKEFVDSGKVRHLFINFPLPIHENAKVLATAAICAGEQNAFWKMHDVLFSVRPRTHEDIMNSVEKSLHIDSAQFQECLDHGNAAQTEIDVEVRQANTLNITATPSFLIGWMDSRNHVTARKLIRGAQPFSVFQKTLNEILSTPVPKTVL